MKLNSRTSTFAALSAAFLLFSAAPVQAQGPVSRGIGSYESPSNPGQTSYFSYLLFDAGSGAAHGYAVWVFPQVTIAVQVTSFGFLEPLPTSLSFAGQIVGILGTPVNPAVAVGRTGFSSFNDNGPHAADETTGFSLAPLRTDPPVPFLLNNPFPQSMPACQAFAALLVGDPDTIQEISALGQCLQSIGQLPPPSWAPLLTGNILIR